LYARDTSLDVPPAAQGRAGAVGAAGDQATAALADDLEQPAVKAPVRFIVKRLNADGMNLVVATSATASAAKLGCRCSRTSQLPPQPASTEI